VFKLYIIQKYIIRKIFPNFLVGVLIFTIVNLIQYLYDFISFAIEKNVPLTKVFQLLYYIIPFLMTFTIPVGVLIGVLLTMGELSSTDEITAMRINGLFMKDILKPCLFFGIIITVFHLLFFQYILPWGNKKYVMTRYEMLRKNPTLEINKTKQFSDEEMDIKIENIDVKTQMFYGIRVINSKDNMLFIAREGKFLEKDKDKNAFPFFMKDVFAIPYVIRDVKEEMYQQFYKTLTIYIKDINIENVEFRGGELDNFTELYNRIKELKMINIVAEIKVFHEIVKKNFELLNIDSILKKETDLSKIQDYINRANIIKLNIQQLNDQLLSARMNVMPKNEVFLFQRKISYAISSILMVFLALPLGIVRARRGKEVALGIGVVIIILYNGLLIAGNFGWKLNYISPVMGAWLPNIIIFPLTIILNYLKFYKDIYLVKFSLKKKNVA